MRRVLALAALMLAFPAVAQVTMSSTRETVYDFACCEDQACVTKTNHQRLDAAFAACLNKSLADGKARWIQGGRWRVNVMLPSPPVVTPPPPAGADVTLSWTAPTTRTDGSSLTNLAGFKAYWGTSSTALTQSHTIADPGARTFIVAGLGSGTWYFSMTAYDATGVESARTNTVSKVVP